MTPEQGQCHDAVGQDIGRYRQYQSGAAFYSMYNIGHYTVAPIKVVWRRMDRRINAAVVAGCPISMR